MLTMNKKFSKDCCGSISSLIVLNLRLGNGESCVGQWEAIGETLAWKTDSDSRNFDNMEFGSYSNNAYWNLLARSMVPAHVSHDVISWSIDESSASSISPREMCVNNGNFSIEIKENWISGPYFGYVTHAEQSGFRKSKFWTWNWVIPSMAGWNHTIVNDPS